MSSSPSPRETNPHFKEAKAETEANFASTTADILKEVALNMVVGGTAPAVDNMLMAFGVDRKTLVVQSLRRVADELEKT